MKAARRSLTYWMSLVLILLAGLLVVGFFWLGGFFSKQPSGPDKKVLRQVEALNKRMQLVRNVVLTGKDKQGRRYEIRATGSRVDETQPNLRTLLNVTGKIEESQGPPLFFEAQRAQVDVRTRKVTLIDKVTIRKPGKWTLKGPRFLFDSRTHDLSSEQPVEAMLDNGTIQAHGMQSSREGAIVRFKGPVHAQFEKATGSKTHPAVAP